MVDNKKTKLTRREFMTGTASMAGVLILSACKPAATAVPTQAPAPTKAKPQITVWECSTYVPEADEIQDNQIREWCDKHNVDLTLERMPPEEWTTKWKIAFETKQFPDMGRIFEQDLPKFILAGDLLEVTDITKRLNELEGGFSEGTWLASQGADGKQYALPMWTGVGYFYARKDKVEEKGLAFPDTWDDVLKAAKAITVPGEFWGWGSVVSASTDGQDSLTAKLWAYGAAPWSADGKPAIDSPETRQVLDLMREAWEAGVIPPDAPTWDSAGNNKAYQNGTVGMVHNTGSIANYLKKEDTELLSKTQVGVIPSGPKGRFTPGYYYVRGILKTTKYPEVCRELSEWLSKPEQLRPMYEAGAGFMLPSYLGMIEDETWQDPYLKPLVENLRYTYPIGYPGPTTPWALDEYSDMTMAKMLPRMMVEGWDNDRIIAEANDELQKWYDEWQKKLNA